MNHGIFLYAAHHFSGVHCTAIRYVLCIFVCLFGFVPSINAASSSGDVNSVETYFMGTDYELHVYRIRGRVPGKTVLIIGGIQGNEPGGFLSADLYADLKLIEGNLIVVPRANFCSIITNRRQVNEDMNRKFSDSACSNYESQVVDILKRLIKESDCLLNLHDGSGFYSHTWKSDWCNPLRYGQSIIVDAEQYIDPDTGHEIDLKGMSEQVIGKINGFIDNPDHFFHFNNHRTQSSDSLHPEQRKSATYYALYQCGIPAFGIETSKSLPLETRIYHHNLAVNAFLTTFNVHPEVPGICLYPPILKYLVLKINNTAPIVVGDGETVHIARGDTVKVVHVEANYDRGLSVDLRGYGSLNDMNKPFSIVDRSEAIVRKDNRIFGKISIVTDKPHRRDWPETTHAQVLFFKVRINGTETYVPNGAHMDITKGDRIVLVDVGTKPDSLSGITCNFKGFVGNISVNTGEDRGYTINTATDLWHRYSLYNEGRVYQVVVTRNDSDVIGRMFFDIREPSFEYLVMKFNDGDKRWFTAEDTVTIGDFDSVELVDVKSNVPRNSLSLSIARTKKAIPLVIGEALAGRDIMRQLSNDTGSYLIQIQRDAMAIASVPVEIVNRRLSSHSHNKEICMTEKE